ncbi:SIR2 family protein [Moritella viscosa]|uniref:Uncharacterized protein n=1 Tax=Moritella viscosa TaxID=80854 RepID=A0A1L0AJS9_9GAMM|nr:SIR2 family protein [Moritella viscosa]SGZ17472.1 Putative uncharacterized protein [Moritella viscosa]
MNVKDFISNFSNHPVLFVGAGLSLRYLNNAFTWDGLLAKISLDLTDSVDFYFDTKSECMVDGKFKYELIAEKIESKFNKTLKDDRNGKFKDINDIFYDEMAKNNSLSRFKIYICKILKELDFKDEKLEEIKAFKKIRKNISSVITTNYDLVIEDLFDFNPLIGNDILLSNPYGSIYKIHGCVSQADKIIMTENDYDSFNKKYELIRAQLLSLFIHNPIIFLGYNVGDQNIKDLLKTIFTYVPSNTEQAEKIKKNFLLVEYDEGNFDTTITDHDIDIDGYPTIRINKVKTDDFSSIYSALSELELKFSAMDIRKVQHAWREITTGGEIKVKISEDLDSLSNDQMILAVGSTKTIKYEYQPLSEMMTNYFNIIEESNSQLIETLNKQTISRQQYCPIFAFSLICKKLEHVDILKRYQKNKIRTLLEAMSYKCKTECKNLMAILNDELVSNTHRVNCIVYNVIEGNVHIDELYDFLATYFKSNFENYNPNKSDYNKLLCTYDFKKYSDAQEI